MTFIKSFEGFSVIQNSRIFVANPEAETFLKTFEQVDGFYSSRIEEAIEILEQEGFTSPQDFIQISASINEAFDVKYDGHDPKADGTEIFITINGHRYGYSQKDGDLDIADVARKFKTMLGFSAGKAVTWLKKHTVLTSGSAKTEIDDTKQIKEAAKVDEKPAVLPDYDKEEEIEEKPALHHDSPELKNYMFFGNLKTIKRCIDKIMAMDPAEIDELLCNGHDWAEDHITTSKDDVEEVCNFLCNAIDKTE
jgi:hypothetical protein